MSGVYNNWFKVQHPDISNNITPMESGGFQKPFFFGGSQVPVNLGIEENHISGSGLYKKNDFKPEIRGKLNQKTIHKRINNIHIPRHLKFI